MYLVIFAWQILNLKLGEKLAIELDFSLSFEVEA
jgi:hypothetical protein